MATAIAANHQTTLQLTGMTCAACANKIEKGLGKLEGVASANVNFALEKASVTYDPAKVDVQRLEETIKKLGYGTAKEVVDFKLEGMTCAACATKIEKGLGKLSGVTNASVNFAMETARVEYNAADVSIADMQQRVEKLGYKAIAKHDEANPSEHREKAISQQKRKLLISAVLSLPLLWSMVGHFSFLSWIWMPDLFMNPWFQMTMATPVQFYIGKQFYVGAFKALRNKSANMDTSFPAGGDYKVFADFIPTGGANTTLSEWVKVEGKEGKHAAIAVDTKLVKEVDGKEIELIMSAAKPKEDVTLTFNIRDAKTKKGIDNLQPYLGAVGHVVILSEDANQYLHVHPIDEKATGPDAKFATSFPQSGTHKIWGQFQQAAKYSPCRSSSM
ncbi:hypothetical protein GCM10020370_68480 [Paenibacillus hodogayensis]